MVWWRVEATLVSMVWWMVQVILLLAELQVNRLLVGRQKWFWF